LPRRHPSLDARGEQRKFSVFFDYPLDDQHCGIKFAATNLFCRNLNLRSISRRVFMATKIRPLHDRVIVKRIAEEEKTKGGIIIPDTAKEKPQEGKVVAVGPGKYEDGKLIPLGVKSGDKILFGKYSGSEIKLDGEEHLIMREDDILGVVE
jgi:chaperonin GroES